MFYDGEKKVMVMEKKKKRKLDWIEGKFMVWVEKIKDYSKLRRHGHTNGWLRFWVMVKRNQR